MQHRIVGQRSVGAHPHELSIGPRIRFDERVGRHVAHVDRSRCVVPGADLVAERGQTRVPIRERFRRRDVGRRRDGVVEAGLRSVEACLEVEDRPPVLDRHDAARGEARPVADAVDVVDDRHLRVSGAEEVGVQRVHPPVLLVDRARRRHQRLPGDLPAEHALAILVRRDAAEQVDLDPLQVEQRDRDRRGRLTSTPCCHAVRCAACRRLAACSTRPSARWRWRPRVHAGGRGRRAPRGRDRRRRRGAQRTVRRDRVVLRALDDLARPRGPTGGDDTVRGRSSPWVGGEPVGMGPPRPRARRRSRRADGHPAVLPFGDPRR